ncbi:MarR family transcriptional regulator [Streptomyces uncialis]|uniref:MarR family transcriptional regulator n=1 Tax=Streptomyces uncialis TaxID=1048205 RepID=UPI00386B81D5
MPWAEARSDAQSSSPGNPTTNQVTPAPLRLVKNAAASGIASNRDKVLGAVQAGARTAKEVADATGLNKGTVSREIKALTASGALQRTADGRILPGQQAA